MPRASSCWRAAAPPTCSACCRSSPTWPASFTSTTPIRRHWTIRAPFSRDGLLAADGSLFFTNIAEGNPYRPLIEYFGDWFLIERSEETLRGYCDAAGIPAQNVAVTREETGLAYLVEITR